MAYILKYLNTYSCQSVKAVGLPSTAEYIKIKAGAQSALKRITFTELSLCSENLDDVEPMGV